MKNIQRLLLLFCFSIISVLSWAGSFHQGTKLFTMTNSAEGNEIIEMLHHPYFGLIETARTATGGLGTSGGLGNQGALAVDHRAHLLFAVNAGSNSFSVFRIKDKGLKLIDTVDSGGERPVSLTLRNNLLYVLNAGSDSIAGFKVHYSGKTKMLEGSVAQLSGSGTAPAQISFSPWGDFLVVTEKATNNISVFSVEEGSPSAAVVTASEGRTPFGFDFDRRGHVLVSEAAGGESDASSVSSYEIKEDGSLAVISSAVPTTETAACWLVVSKNGRQAFVTNAGSSSISAYRIGKSGKLYLSDSDGVAAETGEGTNPIDMIFSPNGRFLYALSASSGSISAFKYGRKGELRTINGIDNLPTGVNGLASF